MNAIRIEATIQNDGELRLTELPFRKGDRVEATVSALTQTGPGKSDAFESSDTTKNRKEALERFLARAAASKFHSAGSYPSRDELHERH